MSKDLVKDQLIAIHTNLERLLVSKAQALPKNFNKTRFLQNCMAVLQDTRDIEKMNPVSVARTMLKGAFLGLDFFRKECYAIPYGNTLQFQTDYKGEIKLAKKYSKRKILDIYAKLVREGDHFVEKIVDGVQKIEFVPQPFSDKPIIGAFAVCYFRDGGMIYETMSVEELINVRNNYAKKTPKEEFSPAWRKSEGEMFKKTVLRRLTKMIDLEFTDVEIEKTYVETSDFEFNGAEEVPYEPVAMPEIIEPTPPETAKIDEKIAETDKDIPPTGDRVLERKSEAQKDLFNDWGVLSDAEIKKALETLRTTVTAKLPILQERYDINTPGDFLRYFKVSAFNRKDISHNLYEVMMKFLNEIEEEPPYYSK